MGFENLSVAQIRAGLTAREFSARDIAQASFDAIASRDPEVHAFLEQTPQLAFAAADAVDAACAAGEPLGALAGVPIAFKDNMNLQGTHTTCSSRMLQNYVSPYTATCVDRALRAGALPLGKTNLDEFAFGSSTETSAFGCTHNPWDLARVPGGSSGGSVAAVAAGMATVALGSDTGGSIRQPASFCGVVGMKPSYGVVSRFGVVAFGSSLDQVGPVGKTVADVAATLDAIAGRDERDCTSQPLLAGADGRPVSFSAGLDRGIRGMRIGVVPAFVGYKGVEPEVIVALEDALAHLEGLGAELVEIELPHVDAALAAYYVIGPCEAFSNMSCFDSVRYGYRFEGARDIGEQYERSRAEGFGMEVARRIMLGSYLLSSGVYDTYYLPAQQVRTLIIDDYARAFEKVDALVTLVSPRAAFKLGEIGDPTAMHLSDMFTVSANIAGNGALSLPVGLGASSGLPVGVQVIGPQFGDAVVLRVAAALEGCYGFERLAPMGREAAPMGREAWESGDGAGDLFLSSPEGGER